MKNRNLLFALLLALPFFIIADNDVDEEIVNTEDEEVVVTEEEVVSSDSSSLSLSEDDVEEVVVTGSRMKKSTFTSISPLQIISADTSREVGLIDATRFVYQISSLFTVNC